MLSFLLRRLLLTIPLLIAVIVVSFLLLELLPGDPVELRLGKYASAEQAAEVREQLGLDAPLPQRMAEYALNALQGDFGYDNKMLPVGPQIAERLPATIELSILAMLFALAGGVSIGLLTALKPRSWVDMLGLTGALAGVSVPIFLLGFLAREMVQPGGWLSNWVPGFTSLPAGGRHSVEWSTLPTLVAETPAATGFYTWDTLVVFGNGAAFADVLMHLLIPALVLASVPMALVARITRASVGESMLQDYIRTARAKGLGSFQVVTRHALRNALIPIVTTTGTQFAYLLSGAVLTETIFSWPGLGTFTVAAIKNRDWNQLQAVLLVVATIFVVVNLLVDLSYGLLDPRVRRQGGKP